MKVRKRARVEQRCFIIDNVRTTWSTDQIMLEHFRRTKLFPWCLVANRLGLPKDIRKLIMSKIEKNYARHPVWEFIKQHRDSDKNYKCCVVIYKQKTLYNYKDDPRGKRARPFYITLQNQRVQNNCFRHDNVLVWVIQEHDEERRSIHPGSTVIRLDH